MESYANAWSKWPVGLAILVGLLLYLFGLTVESVAERAAMDAMPAPTFFLKARDAVTATVAQDVDAAVSVASIDWPAPCDPKPELPAADQATACAAELSKQTLFASQARTAVASLRALKLTRSAVASEAYALSRRTAGIAWKSLEGGQHIAQMVDLTKRLRPLVSSNFASRTEPALTAEELLAIAKMGLEFSRDRADAATNYAVAARQDAAKQFGVVAGLGLGALVAILLVTLAWGAARWSQGGKRAGALAFLALVGAGILVPEALAVFGQVPQAGASQLSLLDVPLLAIGQLTQFFATAAAGLLQPTALVRLGAIGAIWWALSRPTALSWAACLYVILVLPSWVKGGAWRDQLGFSPLNLAQLDASPVAAACSWTTVLVPGLLALLLVFGLWYALGQPLAQWGAEKLDELRG